MGFVRRIVTLYRTQVELLWRWRSGRRALIKRTIVALVASVIAFHITAWLLPQLDINELGGALVAVLVIAVLNLLVRPVILGLVASRSVVALVVLTLLFQAAVILLLGRFVPAVTVGGGILGALIISFVFGGIAGAIGLAVRARRGRVVLRHPRAHAGEPSARRDPHRPSPASSSSSSTASRHDVLSHSLRAGRVPEMARWIRDGHAQARPLGRAAALDHAGQPGGHPARQQRRHPQLPLAGEGDRAASSWPTIPRTPPVIESRVSNGEGLLSPGGASHQQHLHRRRRPRLPGDVDDQGQGARPGRQRRLRLVLRLPLQLHQHDRPLPRRGHQGEHPVAAPGARRHRAAHAPRLPLPVGACRDQRGAALAGHLARHPGDAAGHAGHLHGLHRLRRDRPPQRAGATRVARRARRRRPGAAHAQEGRRRRPAPVPLRRPRGPRPEPRRDLPAALRRDPPGRRALADGRPGVGRGGHRADRGLGPAEHVPGRGLADEGRHRVARPDRHAQQARGRARRDGSGGGAVHAGRSASSPPGRHERRGSDRRDRSDGRPGAGARRPRRRRRRQPRAHLLQRQQGAHDPRGDRRASIPTSSRRSRTIPASACSSSAPRPTASSASARTASTTSTRSASRARTRWRSTASTPSRR